MIQLKIARGVTLETINCEFGENVKMIIATESEDKTKTWEEYSKLGDEVFGKN